jgi:hypothetical protein
MTFDQIQSVRLSRVCTFILHKLAIEMNQIRASLKMRLRDVKINKGF